MSTNITITAYTITELKAQNERAYRRAIGDALDACLHFECISDAISEDLKEWLDEEHGGLNVEEWNTYPYQTVRLSGRLALTEEEQATRFLAGMPRLEDGVPIRSVPNRDWVSDYWAHRIDNYRVFDEYETDENWDGLSEWEAEDAFMKPVLERLSDIESAAARYVGELNDYYTSDEYIEEHLEGTDALFDENGRRLA